MANEYWMEISAWLTRQKLGHKFSFVNRHLCAICSEQLDSAPERVLPPLIIYQNKETGMTGVWVSNNKKSWTIHSPIDSGREVPMPEVEVPSSITSFSSILIKFVLNY